MVLIEDDKVVSKSLQWVLSWFDDWLSKETFLAKKLASIKNNKWSILTATVLGGIIYYYYNKSNKSTRSENVEDFQNNTYKSHNAVNTNNNNNINQQIYFQTKTPQYTRQISNQTSRSYQTSTSSYQPRRPSSNLQSITMSNPKYIKSVPNRNSRNPTYDFSGEEETQSFVSSQGRHYHNANSELVRFQIPGSTANSISGTQTICNDLETMTKSGRKDLQDCLTGIEKLLDHAQAALE